MRLLVVAGLFCGGIENDNGRVAVVDEERPRSDNSVLGISIRLPMFISATTLPLQALMFLMVIQQPPTETKTSRVGQSESCTTQITLAAQSDPHWGDFCPIMIVGIQAVWLVTLKNFSPNVPDRACHAACTSA